MLHRNSVVRLGAKLLVKLAAPAQLTLRRVHVVLLRLYSLSYTGGTLAAAHTLRSGEHDIAVCWMGGQTNARRDCASGFSFINDAVLAVLSLLHPAPDEPPEERRVLFVNLDAWHCSGVEEAFYTTDRVMCISLHHYAEGVFPGSGGSPDCGENKGKHYNINLPVKDGLTDADLIDLMPPVISAAVERFCPHAIVCSAGAGVMAGDRLGCLNISLVGHAACLKALMAAEVPLLVLGGGGYTQLNAARTWCHATATLCGVELPKELPEHDQIEYYLPDRALEVPLAEMEDRNTREKLTAIKEHALQNIGATVQRSKPVLKRVRPAASAAPEGAAGVAPTIAGVPAPNDVPMPPPPATIVEGGPAGGSGAAQDTGGAPEATANPPAAGEDATGNVDAAAASAMDVDEGGNATQSASAEAERIGSGMVADEPAIESHEE